MELSSLYMSFPFKSKILNKNLTSSPVLGFNFISDDFTILNQNPLLERLYLDFESFSIILRKLISSFY